MRWCYALLIVTTPFVAYLASELVFREWTKRARRGAHVQQLVQDEYRERNEQVQQWLLDAIRRPDNYPWLRASLERNQDELVVYVPDMGHRSIPTTCLTPLNVSNPTNLLNGFDQTGIPVALVRRYIHGSISANDFLMSLLDQTDPCFDVPLAVSLIIPKQRLGNPARILAALLDDGHSFGMIQMTTSKRKVWIDVHRKAFLDALVDAIPPIAHRVSWLEEPNLQLGLSLQVLPQDKEAMLRGIDNRANAAKFIVFGMLTTCFLLIIGASCLSRRKLHLRDQQRLLLMQAAHQLKTPLASMQLMAGALSDGVFEAGRYEQYARSIQDHCCRLAHTINQLLQLVGKDKVLRNRIPVVEFIERFVLQWDHEQRLIFELDALDDLHGLSVNASKEHLMRALDSMLDNALMYSEQYVVVRIKGSTKSLVVRIMDHGPGVNLEHQAHLFSAFVRGKSGRFRHPYGSGLGLALAQRVIKDSGGQLAFDEPPDSFNTCLTIRLPMYAGRLWRKASKTTPTSPYQAFPDL